MQQAVQHVEVVDGDGEVAQGLRQRREVRRAVQEAQQVVVPREAEVVGGFEGLECVEEAEAEEQIGGAVEHTDEGYRVA